MLGLLCQHSSVSQNMGFFQTLNQQSFASKSSKVKQLHWPKSSLCQGFYSPLGTVLSCESEEALSNPFQVQTTLK